MIRRVFIHSVCALALVAFSTSTASAQSSIGIRGFGLVGNMTFNADDSFNAILGSNKGVIFGGGGTVLLPWNIFLEVGAWQFKHDGERVFVGPGDEVFRLGIPVNITVTPLEITGGYRVTQLGKFVPYGGVGWSSYRYKETSDFADPNANENVDERFKGFHVLGGAEYQLMRWVALGGEVAFSSIPDAIGDGGVSAHYAEDNLGGMSLRFKVSVGR